MFDDVMSVGGAPPAAVYADYVYTGQGGPNEGWPGFLAGIAKDTNAAAWQAAPGCQADPLTKIACIEATGGTPMIFAKPSPDEVDVFTDVQRQLDAVAVLAPALVNLRAYPMVVTYPLDAATTAFARRARLRRLAGAGALRGLVPAPAGRLRHRRLHGAEEPRQGGAGRRGRLAPVDVTRHVQCAARRGLGLAARSGLPGDDQGRDRPGRALPGPERRLDHPARRAVGERARTRLRARARSARTR